MKSAILASSNADILSEPQLVRFIVVEIAHQGSSPRFGTSARIFLNLGLRVCIHRDECACICERLRLYCI